MNDGPIIHDASRQLRPGRSRSSYPKSRADVRLELRRQYERCVENGIDPLETMAGPDGPLRFHENPAAAIGELLR